MGTNAHEAANDVLLEHQPYRLSSSIISVIEDIARDVEEGEAGLKSCSLGAQAAAHAGASGSEVVVRHHHEVQLVEDEDECLDLIREYLESGFSFAEIARRVRLDGGATHLLALERWCEKVRLECDVDELLPSRYTSRRWRGSRRHEGRRRARRAMQVLRQTPKGTTHAAVLHVVYGWPDPFLRTLSPETRSALGREYAPLARYTDAVEAKRQELVRAEAVDKTTRRWVPAMRELGREWRGVDMQADEIHRRGRLVRGEDSSLLRIEKDDRVLTGSEKARAAISLGLDARAGNAGVIDLARHRDRLAWADRCISSGDALRAGTDHLRTPAKDARTAFVTAIRIDANRMLSDASRAFLDAWRRS